MKPLHYSLSWKLVLYSFTITEICITTTHVAGVPALRACADGGAGQVVGGAELRLQREVARVVAPQRHLDLLQHQ